MAHRRSACALVAASLILVAATGCARENDVDPRADEPPPSAAPSAPAPTLRTILALPVVSSPPSGELTAFMQQSSLDVAREQLQVVLVNDTRRDLDPTSVRYRDRRLDADLVGGNLRVDPSQSQRGYPFSLPEQPPCDDGSAAAQPTSYIVVEHEGRTDRVPVDDPTDAVGRFLATRCQELALADAVVLSWRDDLPADHPGPDGIGTLTLVVTPTGTAGHRVRIDGVNGSHLLGSADDPTGWAPGLFVRSDGQARSVGLPLKPTRCDDHAFMEGGNATAFRVRFTLDGEPGEILLRMSPAGASTAIGFAQESCGLA